MKRSTKKKLNDVTEDEWDSIKTQQEDGYSNDPVNHPVHYNKGVIECIDSIEAMLSEEEYIGYLRGSSQKYRWRFRYKNGIEDLKKAAWYEKRMLQILNK